MKLFKIKTGNKNNQFSIFRSYQKSYFQAIKRSFINIIIFKIIATHLLIINILSIPLFYFFDKIDFFINAPINTLCYMFFLLFSFMLIYALNFRSQCGFLYLNKDSDIAKILHLKNFKTKKYSDYLDIKHNQANLFLDKGLLYKKIKNIANINLIICFKLITLISTGVIKLN
jgi:hypothetical protein